MLDRWLGTKPLFMIGLVMLGLIGEFLRFWYDYDARMKVLEAQRAAAASGTTHRETAHERHCILDGRATARLLRPKSPCRAT